MISETIEIFLEENGYQSIFNGERIKSFKKCDSIVAFSEINVGKIKVQYSEIGKCQLECYYGHLTDESIVMILQACGAVDMYKLKKFANP